MLMSLVGLLGPGKNPRVNKRMEMARLRVGMCAGVLILSEFAGAAQSLGAGAILVNPWNINDMASAIKAALTMRCVCCCLLTSPPLSGLRPDTFKPG